MEQETRQTSRRGFIRDAASVAAIGALGAGALLSSCSGDRKKKQVAATLFPDKAPDGRPLKAGLIGCGGRGTGAAINFIDAGPNLEVTALGDPFQDRLNRCRQQLKENRNVEIADENCFVGLDAYQKVIEAGVDVVLLVSPPFFRPAHFEAAIRARKHVFMEKPLAVDPVGTRSIMASGRMADAAGLKVATGTQRRHQIDYVNTYNQVKNGIIGDIVGANAYWNQSQLWYVQPQPGWTQMEAMLRDWVNWCWLSGDHIVEQHMHNIDVVNWFKGAHPVKAVGFGGRHRRLTGDQYDFFSVDYVYDDGTHMHSMCRQINGCVNNVSEFIVGTKGRTNCVNSILDNDNNRIWAYDYPVNADGEAVRPDPYAQTHVNLVTAIRNNTPLNETEECANTTMAAIMGRISAYTGREVTWEEMMNSNLRLGPTELAFGDVDIPVEIPVPGT